MISVVRGLQQRNWSSSTVIFVSARATPEKTGETIISDSMNVNYSSFWFYKRERGSPRSTVIGHCVTGPRMINRLFVLIICPAD